MHKSGYKWQYHSNIVKDISMDFSAHKNPYNNCCQMSFPPQNTPKSIRLQTPLGSLQRSPSPPSQPVKRGRFAQEGMEWKGREELEGGVERKERGGKRGTGVINEEGESAIVVG